MAATAYPQIAERFRLFADECVKHSAPLYEVLSRHIAESPDLLAIASHAVREPIPNVFLGAVQYLISDWPDHDLGHLYRAAGENHRQIDDAPTVFTEFCIQHQRRLSEIVAKRLVQTNEVGRSAVLGPAFLQAYETGGRKPLAIVEIGSSAGLNLLWDQYRIEYSCGASLGPKQSTVVIKCENRGIPLQLGGTPTPPVTARVGIDRHPIDLGSDDERRWLRSLVWPDHPHRARRLEAAMQLGTTMVPPLIAGDALTELPRQLTKVPSDSTLCVFHSAVLYQFSAEEKTHFAGLLCAGSLTRDVLHVSAENEEGLKLFRYHRGQIVEEFDLADFDSHGRWIQWRAE